MGDINVSGAADPYAATAYMAGANDKNTLSIESFIKLLAAQLQNQDMTNPMDNSEMMAQMTQMAMVQSMGAMTESIQTTSAINTQTYAAGLMGQEITAAITKEGPTGIPVATGVKYGKVVSVSLIGSVPVLKLEGDDTEYPLSYVLGMGHIKDPYAKDPDDDGGGSGGTEKPGEGGDGSGGTVKPGEGGNKTNPAFL